MEKLGIIISPDLYEKYVPVPADWVAMMPLGTVVMVLEHGVRRPYRIVRWGKHGKKRLQWMKWTDFVNSVEAPYLPIRRSKRWKFMAKKKPDRVTIRRAFSR